MIIEEVPEHAAAKQPKNLVELCQLYKTSTWFTGLSIKTKTEYERFILALLSSPYGLKPITHITPRMADVIYAKVKEEHGISQANVFLSVWKRIFEYADKYEYNPGKNPWKRVQTETTPRRKQAWTEEQVFNVIEHCVKTGRKGLAIAICLMYDTGQRPGDVMYLTYDKVKRDDLGVFVDVLQMKRKAQVAPALSKYTVGLLGGEEEVFKAEPGRFLVDGIKNLKALQHEFAAVRKELDLKGIQMRDLRRTALTEMGGASDDEMISVSGHSNRDMLNIYSLRNRHKAFEAQRIRHATRNSRLNQEFTSPTGAEETV